MDIVPNGLSVIIQRVKESKVMFDNEKQLLCSNNLSLEIKMKLIRSCIWCVALCGSETDRREHEERVVNVFETWSW